MKKKLTAVIIIFFSALSATRGAEITGAGDYLRKNVVEKKLPNGITLLMLNRGYAPTLAFEMSFRVGSAEESYRTAGAAHMLEHMLFKGTGKIGTLDYTKERPIQERIEAVGETLDRLLIINPKNVLIPRLEAELKRLQAEQADYIVSEAYSVIYSSNGGVGFNASTSHDKTGYYIQLPASKIELWAQTETERLRDPVFREYYLERNNVLEERLMRYDSSGPGLLFEKFIAAAFVEHSYRHPVIGWRSNIPFLSIKDIEEFYRRYYIPSRMIITVVGRQNVDDTGRVIEKNFSALESRPEPPPFTVRESDQTGERRVFLNFESNPLLIIGWHKPVFPSPDDYVFDALEEILTGGKSSLLYRALVLEKKLASSVSSWNGFPGVRYSNLFVVYAAPAANHQAEEVEKAVYDEIDRIMNSLSDGDIKKAVNKIESEMIFGLSSNNGIASLLSYYQTVHGDWRYAISYLDEIRKITAVDIRNAVSKYLRKENRTVGILVDIRKKQP